MNFIVLSSSRGTTFQSVIDRMKDGSLQARCLGLITDSEDRLCLGKAKAAGLPTSIVERTKGEDRDTYCRRLHEAITSLQAPRPSDLTNLTNPTNLTNSSHPQTDTYLACMGWMWILTPWFIGQYPRRILNVHPALLPKFGGKGMYGHHVHDAVLAAHEPESGVTIHLMDSGVDTGPILLQKTCPVLAGDTPDSLQARVQELEKEWYPKVLQMLDEGTV